MKTVFDPGMLTIKNERYGVQLYWPILSFKESVFKFSAKTALVIAGKTWQWDWAGGIELLGFGFGIAKYKE